MRFKYSKAVALGVIALIVAGVGITKLVKASGSGEAAPQVVHQVINIEHIDTYNHFEAQPASGLGQQDLSLGATSYDQNNFAAINVSGQTNLYGSTAISGSLSLTGAVSMTGALNSTAAATVGRLSAGGTAEAQTGVVTSTVSVTSLCNDSYLSVAPVTTTPTLTLPSSTTLFASCTRLATVGQYIDVVVKSLNTSTIWAAGAGGTIINTSALTIAANKGALLRVIHDTTNTYIVAFINLLN